MTAHLVFKATVDGKVAIDLDKMPMRRAKDVWKAATILARAGKLVNGHQLLLAACLTLDAVKNLLNEPDYLAELVKELGLKTDESFVISVPQIRKNVYAQTPQVSRGTTRTKGYKYHFVFNLVTDGKIALDLRKGNKIGPNKDAWKIAQALAEADRLANKDEVIKVAGVIDPNMMVTRELSKCSNFQQIKNFLTSPETLNALLNEHATGKTGGCGSYILSLPIVHNGKYTRSPDIAQDTKRATGCTSHLVFNDGLDGKVRLDLNEMQNKLAEDAWELATALARSGKLANGHEVLLAACSTFDEVKSLLSESGYLEGLARELGLGGDSFVVSLPRTRTNKLYSGFPHVSRGTEREEGYNSHLVFNHSADGKITLDLGKGKKPDHQAKDAWKIAQALAEADRLANKDEVLQAIPKAIRDDTLLDE